jgi:two-component system LytT family response regulator
MKALLIDDERLARNELRRLLAAFPEVEVVGEAPNAKVAREQMAALKPDLIFLDVQMPGETGLQLLESLEPPVPHVIFTTAYDEFAVKAFELNAIDYLLKPVEMGRLRATISRALERLEQADFAETQVARVHAAASAYASATGAAPLRRIPVRQKEHIVLLPVEQVATIIAEGEVLHITTLSGERSSITFRLKDVEARLSTDQFVRLSRGILANIAMIQRVTPEPGGTYTVIMSNGQELHASRIRSRVIRDQLLKL